MLNLKTISVIIVVAVLLGVLMSYRVGVQSGWGRAPQRLSLNERR